MSEFYKDLDIWVCSFGGCGTNFLTNFLARHEKKVRSREWNKKYCHSPVHLTVPIPTVYLYDDIRKSFLSQKRRKEISMVNIEKLSDFKIKDYDEELHLQLMFLQFFNWQNKKEVFYISKDEMLKNENRKKELLTYCGVDVKFSTELKERPRRTEFDFNLPIFKKYQNQINYINEYRERDK